MKTRVFLVLVALVVCMASSAFAAVTAASGARWGSVTSTWTVNTGYRYWTFEPNPVGLDADTVAANVNRFIMHHACTAGGIFIPVGSVVWSHTTADTDTITFRFYNSGGGTTYADSVRIISTEIESDVLPLYADSVAVKPAQTSAAGDWSILTLFKR